jgi:branched-chain amino acid transport system ATP-binding protein
MTSSKALLQVRSLSLSFSGLKALQNVSFSVGQGSILGLIGPNGAGKTTMLNCLTRIYAADIGSIVCGGHDLMRMPLHRICDLGIARTFQNLELFAAETALENVLVGALAKRSVGFLSDLLGLQSARRELDAARRDGQAELRRLGLLDIENRVVATLPYGIQKRIELARALATKPKLLLLDEPAAGLNAEETAAVARLIRELQADGITIILVEHDMRLVMGVCDNIVVLDHGELIACGAPAEIRADERVIKAYLGEDVAHAA